MTKIEHLKAFLDYLDETRDSAAYKYIGCFKICGNFSVPGGRFTFMPIDTENAPASHAFFFDEAGQLMQYIEYLVSVGQSLDPWLRGTDYEL